MKTTFAFALVAVLSATACTKQDKAPDLTVPVLDQSAQTGQFSIGQSASLQTERVCVDKEQKVVSNEKCANVRPNQPLSTQSPFLWYYLMTRGGARPSLGSRATNGSYMRPPSVQTPDDSNSKTGQKASADDSDTQSKARPSTTRVTPRRTTPRPMPRPFRSPFRPGRR